MPAAKLRPVGPSTTARPPVMYSQPWSPTPSTTAVAPELRTQNRSPTLPADEDLAGRGAVRDHVAGDDLLLGLERRRAVGPHDDPAPREALAEVVVGVALEPQGDPARHERAERLAGRPGHRQVDGVVGQPRAGVPLGDLVTEHRADRAVDVADRQRRAHRLAALERVLGERDQLVVERLLQAVVLGLGAARLLVGEDVAVRRLVQDRGQVEARGLPVVDRVADVERVDAADRLLERPEAQLREQLAHLLGDVLEEVDDELRLAGEPLAQHGVLRRHAHRAGVEVADPHHDAAADHQRRGREAVLLRAEQGGDHDVATGLELAVGLHHDPVAQAVEQQGLLGLGEAELPRAAGVLERGQRRGAGAAVVAGDQHHVGVRLGDAGRDRADADLGRPA